MGVALADGRGVSPREFFGFFSDRVADIWYFGPVSVNRNLADSFVVLAEMPVGRFFGVAVAFARIQFHVVSV